jgi:hypothetical protein
VVLVFVCLCLEHRHQEHRTHSEKEQEEKESSCCSSSDSRHNTAHNNNSNNNNNNDTSNLSRFVFPVLFERLADFESGGVGELSFLGCLAYLCLGSLVHVPCLDRG